jgi:hypothetical protein
MLHFQYIITYFNTFLHVDISAPYSHGQKHKYNAKKPTLVGSFKVPTKTQVNTSPPQSHNLNPTLTKPCICHQADRRIGT